MNLKLYKYICKQCDIILNSKLATKNTIAISSLHVLKEHPVLMQKYLGEKENLNLYQNDKTLFKIFNYIINFFIEKKNFYLNNQIKKSEVLIISNIINKKFSKDNKDFYFGNLEASLNKKGVKTVTVLRNFTGLKSSNLNKKINKKKIFFTHRTDLFFELNLIIEIFKEYLNIKKILNKNITNKKIKLNNLVSLRTIAYNLRFGNQVQNLIKCIKPKILIIPFEGHAWERIVINNAKRTFKNLKVASYQFSAHTKYQHSIFRPLKKEYNPDVIFTTGSITKKIFKKKYKCEVKILGSKKYYINKSQKIKKNNFLIIPDAFETEMKFFYNFCVMAAKRYPKYKFYYRAHPSGLKYLKKFKNFKLKNLIISENTLEKDIYNCSFAIFRNSAAVFETISHGLLPVYLDDLSKLNINPLHSVLPKTCYIKKPGDLEFVIKHKNKNILIKKLQDYNKNYFMKFNPDIIKSLL